MLLWQVYMFCFCIRNENNEVLFFVPETCFDSFVFLCVIWFRSAVRLSSLIMLEIIFMGWAWTAASIWWLRIQGWLSLVCASPYKEGIFDQSHCTWNWPAVYNPKHPNDKLQMLSGVCGNLNIWSWREAVLLVSVRQTPLYHVWSSA